MQNIKQKLKFFLVKLLGINSHLNKKVSCPNAWYGNTYGGFFVNPTVLNADSVVYSFGIGQDITFDNALLEKHKCQVFAFDPTPKSIQYIEHQKPNDLFQFYSFGLSNNSGFIDFFLPKNKEHVSGSLMLHENTDKNDKISVEMKTLQDITSMLGHSHIDVLKMDIEGSEYEVIENIVASGISIGQILIEFHERFFNNGKELTKQAIQKLNKIGFEIFAVSKTFEEISFINKSVIKGQ